MPGLPPFFDNNRQIMFRKILQSPLFKPRVMSEDAFKLITGMLNRSPQLRAGYNGAQDIKCVVQVIFLRMFRKIHAFEAFGENRIILRVDCVPFHGGYCNRSAAWFRNEPWGEDWVRMALLLVLIFFGCGADR